MKNNIEAELNAIRVDFYEKTKNMTAKERIAFLKAQVAPIHDKYGIKTISEIKDNGQKAAS